jgi:formate hydrogenlyase transcriptional activator
MTATNETTSDPTDLSADLAWFLSSPVGGVEGSNRSPLNDDRVAAIVATGLSGLPIAAIEEGVDRALAVVGRRRGVERAFYYRLDTMAAQFHLTHEWSSAGRAGMKGRSDYEHLPTSIVPPQLFAMLGRGEVLRLPRTRGLLGGPIEDIVTPGGDRALAVVPVNVAGKLVGLAGFSAALGSAWDEQHFEFLRIVAQGIGRVVERKRIEEELRVSEGRFRAICESSPLGIFLAGQDGGCLYLNPAGERICGISTEAAAGRGWMTSLHPDDRERIVTSWSLAVDRDRQYDIPIHRFVHAGGEIRSVQVRAVPLNGADSRSFLGLLEDVTDRLRAEQERAELSARADAARAETEEARSELARILSRISDGFAAFDRGGRYTYANDRALAIMGRTREQLIGRQVWTEFPELVGSPTHQAFLRAAEAQETTTFEELSARTGRWYELRMYPSPSGVSVFFEDITDRKRALDQLKSDREYLRQELSGLDPCQEIVGLSSALKQVLDRARLVAVTTTSVLITGETGTGKELVARAIHEMSARRERLLVKVNCAAISAGLVESELFGHEKGAFTGALARRKGRFELAHGGTLFLDEVGELPLEMQAKLLRVLQEREFERVGGSETVRVDVRLVAATNRNLTELVEAGRFREDLLYRLNVFPLEVPPLRQRSQDIPLLVHAFVRRFGPPSGKRIDGLSAEAMERLTAYAWPGNVRELQNVIERAVILTTGPLIEPSAFPELAETPVEAWDEPTPPLAPAGGTVDEIARSYVQAILRETEWVIEGQRGAARRLGLHPNTLRSRLKRWGLNRPGAGASDLATLKGAPYPPATGSSG